MVTDLKLFDAFSRQVQYKHEVIDLGDINVYWNGTGTVYLNYGLSDDRIEITSPNGSFAHTYMYGICAGLAAAGPFDITSLFVKGANTINVKIVDICGNNINTTDVVINGNVRLSPFAAINPGRPTHSSTGATVSGGVECGMGKHRR